MRDLAELNNTIPVPSETQAVTEWLQKHRATVHFGIGLNRNKMIIEWQPQGPGYTTPKEYVADQENISLETAVMLIWREEARA
jgi:hypothetical protein